MVPAVLLSSTHFLGRGLGGVFGCVLSVGTAKLLYVEKKNPTYFRLTALSLTVITSLGQTPPPSVAHLHQISNDCLITAFFPLYSEIL